MNFKVGDKVTLLRDFDSECHKIFNHYFVKNIPKLGEIYTIKRFFYHDAEEPSEAFYLEEMGKTDVFQIKYFTLVNTIYFFEKFYDKLLF
jgi:hypothetical protein